MKIYPLGRLSLTNKKLMLIVPKIALKRSVFVATPPDRRNVIFFMSHLLDVVCESEVEKKNMPVGSQSGKPNLCISKCLKMGALWRRRKGSIHFTTFWKT
ncbi:hypothetical protein CEXT_624861 [Caerostris extrusa]|uniref:Uncharacterized protein n=1 Tax=Caerostris extrusa TaxID=172846 RepID=A0AAV4XYA6_CAEEX|nr:hypothetical protein CEXT_624861 [Caerostris extrusa]